MSPSYSQAPPRRQFPLPEDDVFMLNSLGLPWETIVEGQRWLLLHDFPLPEGGYTAGATSLAIAIPASYPQAPLDMVYFYPALQRANNQLINMASPQPIDGKNWQRWSRHYPWRAGIDELETHIGRIEQWLELELKR